LLIVPEPTYAVHVTDTARVTALTSAEPPRLYVVQGNEEREILPQVSVGELTLPALAAVVADTPAKNLGTAGLVVLALEGGGRGPIINHGETITLSLLLSLLQQTIGKEQLHPSLVAELDRIGEEMPNTKEQFGYATHNDMIVLSHSWTGYPPVIELQLAPGSMTHVTFTPAGPDPDDIVYVEVPQQEIVFGHTGVINHGQFTIKAAILEKSEPTVKSIDWFPAAVTGPPLLALTAVSENFYTTRACMGLRIKGSVTVTNQKEFAVSGTMYAQMSVDAGPWVDIATLHHNFKAMKTGNVTEAFDTILAYDRAQHTYKFRGKLVTQSGEEIEREILGSIQIHSVTEFGSGTVLSNDLLIKWASKEKL